jgi:ABC-type antimicrobial peptide transport system permease subunit
MGVIGVVTDVFHNGLNNPAPETVIFPAFARNTVASFVVRSQRVGTAGFLDDLRKAVWSVNPALSLSNVQTMGDLYERSMARTFLTLQLLASTGGIALMLGLIGVYGVVSYGISQRRREIGIRVALGARHGEVRRMFVRQALVVVGIGVALGLAAALALTRLMESQLFGVGPLDPLSYATVSLMLLLTAMIASYIPARRAARVDPLVALRYE